MNLVRASLIGLVLLVPPATAGTLQRDRVPAEARWLVHLDVEALKRSKLYELVQKTSAEHGNEMEEGLAEIRMFVGLDPTTDFRSITLFCATQSEEGCVALLAGNSKVDEALERLRTMASYHTTPAGRHALHSWGGDGETWHAYLFRKDGSDERVVVASQDPGEISRALAVLEGDAESLAGSGRSSIRGTPSSGSILFASAGESLRELGEVPPVSAVAKLAKSIVVDVGEERGALRLHVGLDTRTTEDAQRIHQVLQGAVALVGLVGNEHEHAMTQIQPIVDALRLSVSNTKVDADWRYDLEALMGHLKTLHELEHGDDEAVHERRVEKRRHRREHRREDQDDDDE